MRPRRTSRCRWRRTLSSVATWSVDTSTSRSLPRPARISAGPPRRIDKRPRRCRNNCPGRRLGVPRWRYRILASSARIACRSVSGCTCGRRRPCSRWICTPRHRSRPRRAHPRRCRRSRRSRCRPDTPRRTRIYRRQSRPRSSAALRNCSRFSM